MASTTLKTITTSWTQISVAKVYIQNNSPVNIYFVYSDTIPTGFNKDTAYNILPFDSLNSTIDTGVWGFVDEGEAYITATEF